MTNPPRQLLRHLVLLLGILATAVPVLSAEQSLTVTLSVARLGQTITATGAGFQSGARGLVWGGGPYIKGSVDTLGNAWGVSVANGDACEADGSSGLPVIDISTPAAAVLVASIDMSTFAFGLNVVDEDA